MAQTPEEKRAKAKARREARTARQHEAAQAWLRRQYWGIALDNNFLIPGTFYGQTTYDVGGKGREIVEMLLAFMTPEERDAVFAPYRDDPEAGNPQAFHLVRARYRRKKGLL